MSLLNPPGPCSKNRLFEWVMALALLWMGIQQAVWPASISTSKFSFMLDVIGSGRLTIYLLIVGAVRCAALYINSTLPILSSRVRAITATMGSLIWLQMALSLVIAQHTVGQPPSPSVPLYTMLFLAELYSTYRAAADARFR